MKIRRKPRKLIRVSEAAELLQISKQSVRDQIYKYRRLQVANQALPGTTSPLKLYAAEVEELAKSWGII